MAKQFHGEVFLGVERPFPTERAAQGWPQPVHRLVKVADISRPEQHAALAAHRDPETLHVFSGSFSHLRVWAGFRRLAPSQARLAMYSEAPEQPPLTGWPKRLRGRFLAARWASRFAFALAVGGVGGEFFARAGFPVEKNVPFGYFLDPAPLPESAPRDPAGTKVRLLSAASLSTVRGWTCSSPPRRRQTNERLPGAHECRAWPQSLGALEEGHGLRSASQSP